ncbi:hypothetical protein [Vibrio sp. 10N.222.54.B6]|uniref:hypothetical protein n=1 Tax=Vibrio sp. 10N.222.54.B6 TaxID=1884468 RepID=UPI000C81C71F|nr:hypothetical protein [Vibrio sp. 10N.222.54.B6]PMO17533.1 hypothetical protein BCT16_14965 [Vibrio sp. 10N.222.54.B6]
MISLDKVVILILSTTHKSYDQFKKAQEDTWVKKMRLAGVKCYFYEGDKDESFIKDGIIGLETSDQLSHCSDKLSKALELLVNDNPNVELVYRTNLSSYIDVEVFLHFIKEIQDPKSYYAGNKVIFNPLHAKYFQTHCKIESFIGGIKSPLVKIGLSSVNRTFEAVLRNLCKTIFKKKNIEFASGSGFFIGVEHFNKIISYISSRYVDDVMVRLAIGQDMSESIPRFDFTKSFKSINESDIENKNLFHYRFKTDIRDLDSVLLRVIDNVEIRNSLIYKSED